MVERRWHVTVCLQEHIGILRAVPRAASDSDLHPVLLWSPFYAQESDLHTVRLNKLFPEMTENNTELGINIWKGPWQWTTLGFELHYPLGVSILSGQWEVNRSAVWDFPEISLKGRSTPFFFPSSTSLPGTHLWWLGLQQPSWAKKDGSKDPQEPKW